MLSSYATLWELEKSSLYETSNNFRPETSVSNDMREDAMVHSYFVLKSLKRDNVYIFVACFNNLDIDFIDLGCSDVFLKLSL